VWSGTCQAHTTGFLAPHMVQAQLAVIEAMTGHWEFTMAGRRCSATSKRFKGEFLAQNVISRGSRIQ